MEDLNLFLLYCRKLRSINIQYMVTGSVASIRYGEPRLTHDKEVVRRGLEGQLALVKKMEK